MNILKGFDGFEFKNDGVLNDHIKPVRANHDAFAGDFYFDLLQNLKTSFAQFDNQRFS